MRKGKYIDYTILLACLSKMPEPKQNKDQSLLNGHSESPASKETELNKAVKVPELESA